MKGINKKLEQLSVELVNEYYQGNMDAVLDNMREDVTFLALGKGQLLNGLKPIREALTKWEKTENKYEILSMSCQSQVYDQNVCNVTLQMEIISYSADETVRRVNQRITALWMKAELEDAQQELWQIAVIHASLAVGTRSNMELLPHISEQLFKEVSGLVQQEERIGCRDVSGKIHYMLRSQIMWIQAEKGHSILHTTDGEAIPMSKALKDFAGELGENFVRIHNSYIVNIVYTDSICRYIATLRDGTKLPTAQIKDRYAMIKKKMGKNVKLRQVK